MKKNYKITIVLLLVLLPFIINQFYVNSYDGRKSYSLSKEQSKKNDLYIREYIPKNRLVTNNHGDTLLLKNAWVESSWVDSHTFFFFYKQVKIEGVNLFIHTEGECWSDNFHYSLLPSSKYYGSSFGGIDSLGYIYNINGEVDTISFTVRSKIKDSWEFTEVVDTITYYPR
jgi:hypothetical protein